MVRHQMVGCVSFLSDPSGLNLLNVMSPCDVNSLGGKLRWVYQSLSLSLVSNEIPRTFIFPSEYSRLAVHLLGSLSTNALKAVPPTSVVIKTLKKIKLCVLEPHFLFFFTGFDFSPGSSPVGFTVLSIKSLLSVLWVSFRIYSLEEETPNWEAVGKPHKVTRQVQSQPENRGV